MTAKNCEQYHLPDPGLPSDSWYAPLLLSAALIGLILVIALALLPGILNDPTAAEVLAPTQVENTSATRTE